MAGNLGCPGEYLVVAHWRGGERQFGLITGVTNLAWSRRLDKTSTCTLEVTKAEADPACVNGVLDKLAEWVHEISLYRDGKLVWQGPVTSILERRTRVSIIARDVTAWMDRRINLTQLPKTTADAATIARTYVQRAFATYTEPGTTTKWDCDPNVLAYLTVTTGAPRAKVDRILARSSYYGPLLRALTTQGMDFTCVGRRIIIGPEATRTSRAQARLTDADFSAEVGVMSDGMAIATRATVTWVWTPDTAATALSARSAVGSEVLFVNAGVRPVDGAQEAREPDGSYPWDGSVPQDGTPEALIAAVKGESDEPAAESRCTRYGAWLAEQVGDPSWECGPWSAALLAWAADQSGNAGAFPVSGDPVELASWFQSAGRWSGDPLEGARGALAFYDLDGDGIADHVALVLRLVIEGMDTPRLETVEGNTDDRVAVRVRALDGLLGYGFPTYPAITAPARALAASVRADPPDKRVSRSVSGFRRSDATIWNMLDALQVYQTETKDAGYALWRPKLTTLLTQTDPPRPMVQVPDDAYLLPTAPITMEQLVPGVRIDIALDGYQRASIAGLRLSDVEVTWAPGENERVQVAFAPLRGQETPPDVWDET